MILLTVVENIVKDLDSFNLLILVLVKISVIDTSFAVVTYLVFSFKKNLRQSKKILGYCILGEKDLLLYNE